MELGIDQVGVICEHCDTRNRGDSDMCSDCGSPLIPARPVTSQTAQYWVEAQLDARNRLNMESPVASLKILREWADNPNMPAIESGSTVMAHIDSPAGQSEIVASKPPSLTQRTCEKCENRTPDTKARFCPQCGAALPEISATDALTQVEGLAAQLHELRLQVESLQSDMDANSDDQDFLWQLLSDDQKWKVTWGVWGRSVLIQIGLSVGLFLILFAALGVAAT